MMQVYSVSRLTTYLRELLESEPHLADLWVEGEVSNFTQSAAGHSYFTLKDESAQVRCVMFRRQQTGALLENGVQIVAHGRISFFPPDRGSVQHQAEKVESLAVLVLPACANNFACIDVDVNAIKKRSGDSLLVAGHRRWVAGALAQRISKVAAWAGILTKVHSWLDLSCFQI